MPLPNVIYHLVARVLRALARNEDAAESLAEKPEDRDLLETRFCSEGRLVDVEEDDDVGPGDVVAHIGRDVLGELLGALVVRAEVLSVVVLLMILVIDLHCETPAKEER